VSTWSKITIRQPTATTPCHEEEEYGFFIGHVTSTPEIDNWMLMSLELLDVRPDISYVQKQAEIVDVLRRRDTVETIAAVRN
jgi:hypothetical protein